MAPLGVITTSLDSQARPPAQPAEAEPSRAENKKASPATAPAALTAVAAVHGESHATVRSAQRRARQAKRAVRTARRDGPLGGDGRVARRTLSVVCCMSFVARCLSSVACRPMHVVCRLLHVAARRNGPVGGDGRAAAAALDASLQRGTCRTLCRTHVQNYAPCMVQCYAALPTGQYGAVLCSAVVYYALCSDVYSRVVNPFTVLCTAMQYTA